MRSYGILLTAALLAGSMPARAEEFSACERQWTSSVPFYQSVAWSPDGSGLKWTDPGGAAALYPVFSSSAPARHDVVGVAATDGCGEEAVELVSQA